MSMMPKSPGGATVGHPRRPGIPAVCWRNTPNWSRAQSVGPSPTPSDAGVRAERTPLFVQRLLSILVSAGAVIAPAVVMAAAPASASVAPLARNASISAGPSVAAAPAASGTAKLVALAAPVRLLDTRAGAAPAPVAQGATVSVPVSGAAGVPTGAAAAVLNVTVVAPAPVGFWTVWPHDQTRP